MVIRRPLFSSMGHPHVVIHTPLDGRGVLNTGVHTEWKSPRKHLWKANKSPDLCMDHWEGVLREVAWCHRLYAAWISCWLYSNTVSWHAILCASIFPERHKYIRAYIRRELRPQATGEWSCFSHKLGGILDYYVYRSDYEWGSVHFQDKIAEVAPKHLSCKSLRGAYVSHSSR